MIAALRRARQKLTAIATGWMPEQAVTMLALRPMPWELDRAGRPRPAFWSHLAALAAEGWCSESGQMPAPPRGRPRLRSHSGKRPFPALGRLTIATQLSAYGEGELILSHLVCSARGEILASITSSLPLAEAPVAEKPAIALHSAIAPARPEAAVRPA